MLLHQLIDAIDRWTECHVDQQFLLLPIDVLYWMMEQSTSMDGIDSISIDLNGVVTSLYVKAYSNISYFRCV